MKRPTAHSSAKNLNYMNGGYLLNRETKAAFASFYPHDDLRLAWPAWAGPLRGDLVAEHRRVRIYDAFYPFLHIPYAHFYSMVDGHSSITLCNRANLIISPS